jgi:imidazolonepropionase-like amidohydrolase
MFIEAARLIDGGGATITGRPVVEIDGARIVAVHPNGLPEGAPEAEVLRFADATILPGLIDCHVHLNLPGNGLLPDVVALEGHEVMLASAMGAVATALGAGITTLRDVGCFGTTAFSARRALELGYARGARIVAAGRPLTITGGHVWPMGGEADGEDGLRLEVRRLIKQGAELIKVIGSGGGTRGTASWRPAFTPAEMRAIVEESHRNERRVTVHCLCAASIDMAIEAGVDQIEHAGFICSPAGEQRYEPEVAERLARSDIPVTTTLAVGATAINAMRLIGERTPAEEAFLKRWERTTADNLEQFARLAAAGVRFVAGTDAGWRFTPFDGLILELQMMRRGGATAMDAIVAATGRAAEVIGFADRIGRIAPGLAADLIVVDGDPLADLDRLRDFRLVLQGGVRRRPTPRAEHSPVSMRVPI